MTKRFKLSLVGIAVATLASQAVAADAKPNDWAVSVGGIINAFYTATSCSGSQAVGGLALATQALGCGGTDGRTVIGNGLLPNALVTTIKGQQEGYDIGGTLMIGAAVSSSDSISNNSAVDVRQGFLTIGDASMGTVKLGRDYGLFGQTAILSDMTLIGAGAPVAATQRNRVTLGHIGAGYTYLGHYGQFAYSTPSLGGLTVTAAVMSPVDSYANVYTGKKSPQVQALASFGFTGGKAWVGAKTQKFEGPADNGFTMKGAEVGASYAIGPVGLLANVQHGKGIGILADGDSGNLKQTNLLLQGTFQVTPKAKLGLNWGESKLKDGVGTDLKSNANVTGGVYYSLTKSVTLSAELSQSESKDFAGDSAKLKGIAFGGIMFF